MPLLVTSDGSADVLSGGGKSLQVPFLTLWEIVGPYFSSLFWSFHHSTMFGCVWPFISLPVIEQLISNLLAPLWMLFLLVFSRTIINSSLTYSLVQNIFKHTVVQPVLKKSGLHRTVLLNFRPISKLALLSKLLEKLVFIQLKCYLVCFSLASKLTTVLSQLC